MAEHDENDERDSGISQAGRVGGSVTDPPTLPPFADGPRPPTIHGFPKGDVFGSGDLDNLFDVPKLGGKPSVSPPPVRPTFAAPPPVAPLSGRKAPPTGPLPTLPPIGNASAAREPTPGSRVHQVDVAGVPTELPDESPSGTLPPASSLIEKIRAAKRGAPTGDDAKPGPRPKLPPVKPLAASKQPLAAKPIEPGPSKVEAWLEPVPLESLDRRPELANPGIVADPLPSSEATLRADTNADASSVSPPSAAAAEPEPALEEEQTIAVTPKPVAVSSVVTPPPPSASPLAPPPPPTTTAASEGDEQPKIGAPYVPPAVVLRADETLDDELVEEKEAGAPTPEPPRPARLPLPGSRLPPADPVVAARLAQVAAEQPTSAPLGVPQMVSPQDTASLVDGLANELIAEVESEQAVTLRAKVPVAANEPPSDHRRRKFALGALAVGVLLSILALVLPGGDSEDASLVPDIDQSEPDHPDATLAAQAKAHPQPEPEPVAPPPAEPEPELQAEPQAEPEPAPQAEPAPEPTPKPASNKPAPGPKRGKKSQPAPAPKQPEPKPAPTPSTSATDNRSADDLYKAAQSAYNSGRASEAYKLASDSYRKSSKSKTAELMTLAACKLRDAGKARSAIAKVTALKRNGVRKDCKAMGIEL